MLDGRSLKPVRAQSGSGQAVTRHTQTEYAPKLLTRSLVQQSFVHWRLFSDAPEALLADQHERLARKLGDGFTQRFMQLLRHALPDHSDEEIEAIMYQKAFPPEGHVDRTMWEMEEVMDFFDESEQKKIRQLN